MEVSVIICEHSLERYDDFRDAVESVFNQTYHNVEVVLVSDGNEEVCETMSIEYGHREDVVIECNNSNVGLLESRNNGAEAASGDIVAFLDDDAVANEDWIAEIVATYKREDVPAVGGKMTPAWVSRQPGYLPEEFFWLIGVTHRGFAEGPGEVRNTPGSNISFRREVFLELNGFDTEIGGRTGDVNLQGGETELCARLRQKCGYGVYYNPDAIVAHKVFEYRTEINWLLDRAFWQGYSKRGMEVLISETNSTDVESDFLRMLLFESAPNRVRDLFKNPTVSKIEQLCMLFVFTLVVGFGYLYGILKWH